MRIGILTQYFPPEMGAPQARLYELAIRLRDRGHKITVLTAMPNYPSGKVFPEYRWKLFNRADMNGLRVIRTPILPSQSRSLLVRLISYMSFVFTSLFMGIWAIGRQDLLIVESPPLFLALSGIPMSRLIRAKMVLMVSDIWPDVAVRMGGVIGERQARVLERLEKFVYHHSTCVALTNPGAVEQVVSRFPDVPCNVISNGVDTEFFRPELRSESVRREFGVSEGQFAVGYCGLHGVFQGLEVVVEAANLLRDDPRFSFVMVGDGPTKNALMTRAEELKLDNMVFHSRQPKDRMPEILASMDVSMIPLAASLPGTMPSKVYEALAAGVPIVVTAGCEAEQLVKKYDVGRLFPAGDARVVADALLEFANDPSLHSKVRSNAIALAPRFDRNRIADRVNELLAAIQEGGELPKVEW